MLNEAESPASGEQETRVMSISKELRVARDNNMARLTERNQIEAGLTERQAAQHAHEKAMHLIRSQTTEQSAMHLVHNMAEESLEPDMFENWRRVMANLVLAHPELKG